MRLIAHAAAVLAVLGRATVAAGGAGRPHEVRRRRARSNIALIGSLVAILAVTLAPMRGANEIHLVPLSDIVDAFSPPYELVQLLGLLGNVLLFTPLGVVLRFRRFPLQRAVLAGATLASALEAAQLVVPGRTTSVDDALLNTLGVLIGYCLVGPWPSLAKHQAGARDER